MAGKEGESYLDQLLNNASTSSQEAGVEQAKENARKAELDNVGLQEALAVLNDLPDETGIPAKADPKEELEDLKKLYEEFGNEVIPEEAPQPEPEPEVSREPVAVDDIFQDALSAVGYSGDEEDLEQKLNMSSETQNENQDSQFDDILALDDIMQNESGVEEEPAEEGVQSVPVRKQKKEKRKKQVCGNAFLAMSLRMRQPLWKKRSAKRKKRRS